MSKDIDAIPAYGRESFQRMKQWKRSKYAMRQPPVKPDYDVTESESGGVVPTIVISRGSDKSLHRVVTSPPIRRPSPLAKTWLNYHGDRDSPATSPDTPSVPVPHSPQLLKRGLNHLFSSVKAKNDFKSESLPTTPFDSDTLTRYKRPHTTECSKASSPVFRFSAKQRFLAELEIPGQTSVSCSGSELDSHSICGSCGQRKYYGSRDFVGFTKSSQSSLHGSDHSHKSRKPSLKELSRLDLRRSSSCRYPEAKSQSPSNSSNTISKATSSVDIQRKKETSKLKRMKRTGSKERSRSFISLTRSWSLNLDTLRLVRTPTPTKAPNNYNRKMSLNDNELRRVQDRRRSSLLRFCIEQRSFDTGTQESRHDTDSSDEELAYSPKVTRPVTFNHTMGSRDPLEGFRSTFESESIKIPSVYGQIKVMFQFFSEKNELQVTLLKGSNLARICNGTLGVYAKLSLMPGKLQRKACNDKHDTHDPVFYEMFSFRVILDQLLESQLRIKFYNKPGIFSRSQHIGECQIPLYHYDLTAVTVIWQNLMKSKGQTDEFDEFDFSPIEKHCVKPDGISRLFCGLVRRKKPNKSRDSRSSSVVTQHDVKYM